MGEKESISGMGWGGMFRDVSALTKFLPEIVGLLVGLRLRQGQAQTSPGKPNGSQASQKPPQGPPPSLSSINTIQHRRLCQMNRSPIRTHWLRGTSLHSYPYTSTTPNELLE